MLENMVVCYSAIIVLFVFTVAEAKPINKMQMKEKTRKKRLEKRMRFQPKSVLDTGNQSDFILK